MMEKILIVGAHFDDAELAAGGAAAKFIKQGKQVYKITLTDNEAKSADMDLDISLERTQACSADACRRLGGVVEIPFPPQVYGRLRYSQELMQRLEHIIFEFSIDTVFFHSNEDYNTDHLAAYQICKTAARLCRNLFMFHTNPYILEQGFSPNFFVDISEEIELKRSALACYEAKQNREGKLFETVIQRNAVWGYGNRCAYAEGFRAIKYLI